MAVYKADILDVELNTGNIARSFLCHNIGKDDTKADRFGVRVYRDGEPESLSGCSIQGYMMRPNGTNLAITGSNTGVSGNEAWVDLPQAAYDYEGQFCLALKLIGGGVTGTIRIIDGMINNTFVDDALVPMQSVPTYQEILAVYDQMVAAKNGSVRFDQSQSLTETQKSVARMNIDAASESDVSDLKSAFESIQDTSEISIAGTINANVIPSQQKIVNASYCRCAYAVVDNYELVTVKKAAGSTFRLGYSTVLPAYNVVVEGIQQNPTGTEITSQVPQGCKYIAICYYNSNTDSATPEELLASIEIIGSSGVKDNKARNDIDSLSNDMEALEDDVADLKSAIDDVVSYAELPLTTFNAAYISPSELAILGNSNRKSVYASVAGLKEVLVTKMLSARFVFGFTEAAPALNVQVFDYSTHNNETRVVLQVPSGAEYIVVYCYDSNYDTATWEEIFNSLAVSHVNGAKDYEAREYIDSISHVVSDVPSEYERIDYLESSRTQYINTGLKLNNNSRVIIDAECPNNIVEGQAEYIFGGRSTTTSDAFGLGRSSLNGVLYVGYGRFSKTDFELEKDRHLYDFNKNNLYVDEKLVYTGDDVEFETPNNAMLFALTGTGSNIYYGAVRIYSCKIYNDNILARDFVPVCRLSDGVCGMYDKVDDVLYTNVGTGDFVKVPQINLFDKVESIQEDVSNAKKDIDDIQEDIFGKNYILTEAERVSRKVHDVQTDQTLTFIACSDLHYAVAVGSSDDVTVKDSQNALKDMTAGILAIAEQTHIDFYACFGDVIYQWQNHGANYENGVTEMFSVTKLLSEAFKNNPQIRMVGNHDPNCENSQDKEFSAYMMNSFAGIYSEMLKKDESFPYGGYGYHDFERQKVRLIVLNTSFYKQGTDLSQGATVYGIGADQAYWLCTVLDLSDKTDAEEWQIIIGSHVVMDAGYADICRYTAVLDAYLNGSTWSYSSKSYDFSGKNAAKLALYLNGHTHAYRFKNLRYVNASSVLQKILPMANLYIPNALPGRESVSIDGETYTKTAETAESTSFQVITIDFVNDIVYAHHYGAGIDIVMHYEPSTETSLTTELTEPTWASVDETIATVDGGTVTPVAEGYAMIYAKSETDNCIEVWNYQSVI